MKDLLETIAGESKSLSVRKKKLSRPVRMKRCLWMVHWSMWNWLQLNLPAQEEDADFHTVAGLIMEELQSIPDVGDSSITMAGVLKWLRRIGQRIARKKSIVCRKRNK